MLTFSGMNEMGKLTKEVEKGKKDWPKFKGGSESLITFKNCKIQDQFKALNWCANNEDEFQMMEAASHALITNAKSMAIFAAFMANGGSFQGKQMLSENTWNLFHDEVTDSAFFGTLETAVGFSQGGACFYPTPPQGEIIPKYSMYDRANWIGWVGLGGSVLQWNKDLKIGFGYHTLLHHQMDFMNIRGAKLQQIV